MSSTTQANNNQNTQDTLAKDAFQDAFSALIEHYFDPEEEDEYSGDWPPCPDFTPEEEEEIIKAWSECSLRQLALTWGEEYVAELRNQSGIVN